MDNNELPETYEGYSTTDLLGILEALQAYPELDRHRKTLQEASPEKVKATQKMALEFQLTPVARQIAEMKERRKKEQAQ